MDYFLFLSGGDSRLFVLADNTKKMRFQDKHTNYGQWQTLDHQISVTDTNYVLEIVSKILLVSPTLILYNTLTVPYTVGCVSLHAYSMLSF